MLKEKYISEAQMKEEPKKKLVLKIKEGSITPEHFNKRLVDEYLISVVDSVEDTGMLPEDKAKLDALPTAEELQQALDEKQNDLTFDSTPTVNSNNPVKSKGIKAELDKKQDKLTNGWVVQIKDEEAGSSGILHKPKLINEDGNEVNVIVGATDRYSGWEQGGDTRIPTIGLVKEKLAAIDVSDQISGKANKSEMSVVAGTGANADKTTITLKSGTSATVLTQHQDVSEFIKEGEVFGTGDDSTASFNPYADTVWNKTQTLSESQKQQIRENIGVGAADNEDIQNVSGELKFADKAYNTSSHSGLGRKYLRKNIVSNKNVLTQAMVNTANTIYHIQYDYDLNGQTITLPAGCVLEFEGGSVKNGTLSGVLVTSSGKINAKELGCTYNDSTKGAENVARLKILEGVTNAIHLQVTDTLYLGSGYVEISDSIKIDGGGELRVNGFDGFKVVGDVDVENIKVYGSDIYTSGGTTSRFIDVQSGTSSDVTIKNCYFKGNVRVLHSSKTTDAELTEYFNNITIEGNTFEDIACQPSSIMVNLMDTNYRELDFSGNRIHNFLGVFIHCGITNNSEHTANIANFYANFGRNTAFKNNNVFNDIDFKPWENVAFYEEGAQYYTFALVEKGECYFEKNSVQNIFSNYSSTATYDSYLSVDNLYYQSNNIKNCFNLTGSYNSCLKSKGGSGNRLYANNIIVTENVDDYFDSVVYKTYLMDTEGNTLNQVQIENNIFDVQNWTQTTGLHIYCARLIVRGNSFHAKYIGGSDNAASIYSVLGGISGDVYFENNSVDFENLSADFISRKNRAANILSNDHPENPRYVSIKNNIIKNCIIYDSSNVSANGIYGEISGNEVTYSLERVNTGVSTLFSLSNNMKLNIHDNKISQNTGNQVALSLCPYNISYKTKVRFANTSATTLYLAQFDTATRKGIWYRAFGGLIKFTIKIINHATGMKYIGEINVTIDSTYALGTIKAYKDNGNLITFSSASYTYNMVNNTQSIIYLHPTQGYISLATSLMPANADLEIEMDVESVASINKFKYHKTSGTTALRPAILTPSDLGFEYFDTTLGKPVYAKAIDTSTETVTWVDATGAVV